MDRFNEIIRTRMLETFQEMSKAARMLMQMTREDISRYTGLSEQKITDIEADDERMSVTDFLALATVIEDFVLRHPGLLYRLVQMRINNLQICPS